MSIVTPLLILLAIATKVAHAYLVLPVLNVTSSNATALQTFELNVPTWSVDFGLDRLNMTMTETRTVDFTINGIDPSWTEDYRFYVCAKNNDLLHIARIIYSNDIPKGSTSWNGNFTVEALFLGQTQIFVELQRSNLKSELSSEHLDVIILRNEGIADTIFKVSVACFVILLYINFGAVLSLEDLKQILIRPVGPAIGFVGQFVIMPILGFLIGYVLFHDMIELRLGLFFTGSTPGGGASNIFTVILNGNLNLSITMTAISNFAAFGMMPIWIFTLGALIFRDGNFAIPYATIATMSFSLIFPLCIGIALQKYAPKLSEKMSSWLKPISLILIVFITIFAFTVNSYIFKLFTWEIIIACSALPWLGYFFGWLLAVVFGQNSTDALTIAIETGIQNTGIAIFMLNFTLPQPQADMTSAVPVASSMMTPIPLLVIYFIRKIFYRTSIHEVEEPPNKEAKSIEIETVLPKGQENPVAVCDK